MMEGLLNSGADMGYDCRRNWDEAHAQQIMVYGEVGMARVTSARVLVLGANSIGSEVAKNLVLSGVKQVTLHDHEPVASTDLAANWWLREGDEGSARAEVVVARLRDLNENVHVKSVSGPVDAELVREYQAVVATRGSREELCVLNALCRSLSVPFVLAQAAGLFMGVFSDFGREHLISAPKGGASVVCLVESITRDSPATVTVVDEQRHLLSSGDMVLFKGCGEGGMLGLDDGQPRVVTVTGEYSFTVRDNTRAALPAPARARAGYLQTVPAPRRVNFESLQDCLERPKFSAADTHINQRMKHTHLVFQALDLFQVRLGRLPSSEDADTLIALAHEMNASAHPLARVDEVEEGTMRVLARTAQVEVPPMVAVAAAVAAQEALKAVSGTLHPTMQWFYHDAGDCLPELDHPSPVPVSPRQSPGGGSCRGGRRLEVHAELFGVKMQEALASARWLVAGLGAVGHEVVKNWVLMGVGLEEDGGCITVADARVLQAHNPSNLCLFRPTHVGRPQVHAVAEAVLSVEERVRIVMHQPPPSEDNSSSFPSEMFANLSGVCSSVIGGGLRLFLDEQCVQHRIPMLDPGVSGTLASLQCVVPYQSEPWSACRDAPDKEPPVCTLKNFPYKTEHALKWSRELFDAFFLTRPRAVNGYLSTKGFLNKLRNGNSSECESVVQTLHAALVQHKMVGLDKCVHWARLQFEELFSHGIQQLLHNFPIHMTTTQGAPFWTGTKRAPQPLKFDINNQVHLEFVHAAANLQAAMYGLKGTISEAMVREAVLGVHVPPFEPREGVQIAVEEGGYTNMNRAPAASTSNEEKGGAHISNDSLQELIRELPTPGDLAGYQLTALQFEALGENKLPLQFVVAGANCRAANYAIPSTSSVLAVRIAGGCNPLVPCTAALVGGLTALETYKCAAKAPLDCYRNSYVNLGIPTLVQSAPVGVLYNNVVGAGGAVMRWSLWDQIDMDASNGQTLQQFLDNFKAAHGLEVCMVSYGRSMLYAVFLGKRMEPRMVMSMRELIETVGKTTLGPSQTHVALSLGCEDTHGDDVEVPTVNLKIR